MIWNCDGEIKEIEFKGRPRHREYYCCIGGSHHSWGHVYAWEKGTDNTGSWDWFLEGYTKEYAEWVEI